MICYKFVVYLFDMQLRGARPSTCYGSGIEEGLYQSEIIVYWYVVHIYVRSCGRRDYFQPSACLLHNNLSALSVKCPVPSRYVTSVQPSLMLPICAPKSSINPISLLAMPICSSSNIAVHNSFFLEVLFFLLVAINMCIHCINFTYIYDG